MYSAIADQLYHLGLLKSPSYHETRHAAASYLIANPDTFMPFVPSVMGEDMEGAMDDGIMTPEGYKEYCRIVKEGTNWGGEIEVGVGLACFVEFFLPDTSPCVAYCF